MTAADNPRPQAVCARIRVDHLVATSRAIERHGAAAHPR